MSHKKKATDIKTQNLEKGNERHGRTTRSFYKNMNTLSNTLYQLLRSENGSLTTSSLGIIKACRKDFLFLLQGVRPIEYHALDPK